MLVFTLVWVSRLYTPLPFSVFHSFQASQLSLFLALTTLLSSVFVSDNFSLKILPFIISLAFSFFFFMILIPQELLFSFPSWHITSYFPSSCRLVVVAIFVHVANIAIIAIGTYEPKKKTQLEAPESKGGNIMLYWRGYNSSAMSTSSTLTPLSAAPPSLFPSSYSPPALPPSLVLMEKKTPRIVLIAAVNKGVNTDSTGDTKGACEASVDGEHL